MCYIYIRIYFIIKKKIYIITERLIVMKCKIIETPLKPNKAEPVINEWLAAHSHLNIKFVQETMIGAKTLRATYYYEE